MFAPSSCTACGWSSTTSTQSRDLPHALASWGRADPAGNGISVLLSSDVEVGVGLMIHLLRYQIAPTGSPVEGAGALGSGAEVTHTKTLFSRSRKINRQTPHSTRTLVTDIRYPRGSPGVPCLDPLLPVLRATPPRLGAQVSTAATRVRTMPDSSLSTRHDIHPWRPGHACMPWPNSSLGRSGGRGREIHNLRPVCGERLVVKGLRKHIC